MVEVKSTEVYGPYLDNWLKSQYAQGWRLLSQSPTTPWPDGTPRFRVTLERGV